MSEKNTVYTKMKAKNDFEIHFTINTKPEETKQPGWKLIKLFSYYNKGNWFQNYLLKFE